jgi:ParB-like chromosome segregation protein Spo0J
MSGFSVGGFNLYDNNFSTDVPDLERSRFQQNQRGMRMPTFRGAEGFYENQDSIPNRAITAPPDRIPRYSQTPTPIRFTQASILNQGAEQVETRKQVTIQEEVVKKALSEEEAAKRVVKQIMAAQIEAARIEKAEIDQARQQATNLVQRKLREQTQATVQIDAAKQLAIQKSAERLALTNTLDEKKNQETKITSQ